MDTLSPNQVKKLVGFAAGGMDFDLVAERFGVDVIEVKKLVEQARKRGDIPRAGRKERAWTDEERKAICARYPLRHTASEVAKDYNATRSQILGIWNRAGLLGTRPKGKRPRAVVAGERVPRTERDGGKQHRRDARDLQIFDEFDDGEDINVLAERHAIGAGYIGRLIQDREMQG
jgi:hypothetical protein